MILRNQIIFNTIFVSLILISFGYVNNQIYADVSTGSAQATSTATTTNSTIGSSTVDTTISDIYSQLNNSPEAKQLQDLINNYKPLTSESVTDTLDITVTPETPVPDQAYTIKVANYSTDLNSAKISWYENGKLIRSAYGAITFQDVAPKAGQVSTIILIIQTKEGRTITQDIKIAPANVNIYWQADTYVPPFYKGKRLYTHQSDVTFVAIPDFLSNGTSLNPKNLIYKWKKDNDVPPDSSGFGKMSMVWNANYVIRPYSVSVESYDLNKNNDAIASIDMQSSTPSLIMYENNSTYGVMFNKTLSSSLDLDKLSFIMEAYPLNVAVQSKNIDSLDYTWSINGSATDSPIKSRMALKRDTDTPGTASISLRVQKSPTLLQFAGTSLNLNLLKVPSSDNSATIF